MERARINVEPKFGERRSCRSQDVFTMDLLIKPSTLGFVPTRSVSMSVSPPSLSHLPITSCLCSKRFK